MTTTNPESQNDESLVEQIVHKPAQPAPGAEDQKPTPAATDETAKPAAETTEQQEDERKQSKFQRRLDRQKTARVAAETEVRLLREERAQLLAKLDGQPQQNQTGEPKRENFETEEAYQDKLVDYRAAQKAAEVLKKEREERQGKERQQQVGQQIEKITKTWTERETAFRASTPDYEKIVMPYVEEDLGHLSDGARRAIVESDIGPQLLHHLATNPEDAERIAELTPLQQIQELGKLEDKIPKATKKTTSAPPPATTVRQSRSASDGFRENMSQKEFEAEMKSRGSRWVR